VTWVDPGHTRTQPAGTNGETMFFFWHVNQYRLSIMITNSIVAQVLT
jgi:hypothetical protein